MGRDVRALPPRFISSFFRCMYSKTINPQKYAGLTAAHTHTQPHTHKDIRKMKPQPRKRKPETQNDLQGRWRGSSGRCDPFTICSWCSTSSASSSSRPISGTIYISQVQNFVRRASGFGCRGFVIVVILSRVRCRSCPRGAAKVPPTDKHKHMCVSQTSVMPINLG